MSKTLESLTTQVSEILNIGRGESSLLIRLYFTIFGMLKFQESITMRTNLVFGDTVILNSGSYWTKMLVKKVWPL